MNLPTPDCALNVQVGPQTGQSFVIQNEITNIGSDPISDICLQGSTISPSHIRLVKQAGGVWIQDLGSTHGTFVNGQRLTSSAWLQPNDTIQLGSSVILGVQLGAAGPAPRVITLGSSRKMWLWLMAAAILLAAIAGLVGWRILTPSVAIAGPLLGPTIYIHEPEPRSEATFNTPLFIHASITDQQFVRRAELWVNQAPVYAQNSETAAGIKPFTFVPPWAPLATGQHILQVKAYNTQPVLGESNVFAINALEVTSEADVVSYVAVVEDTLPAVAEKLTISQEQIIVLNPQIQEIADATGIAPADLLIPAGAAIDVPREARPVVPLPGPRPSSETVTFVPDTPVSAGSDSAPLPGELARAGLDSNTAASSAATGTLIPAGCNLALQTRDQEWALEIRDFEAETAAAAVENTYCYVAIGDRTRSTVLRYDDLAGVSQSFMWPAPTESVPISFQCLKKGTPPEEQPVVIGQLLTQINQADWLAEQPVQVTGDKGALRLTYQLRSTGSLLSPRPADIVPTAPFNLQQMDQVSCLVYLWPGPHFASCRNGEILTWQWQPAGTDLDQPICFEVHEQIKRGDQVLAERIIDPVPTLLVKDTSAPLTHGAVVKNLGQSSFGCETRPAYFVRAANAAGKIADSAPFTPEAVSSRPCVATVEVVFESLTVLDIPGTGWEKYQALFYANDASRAWSDAPGLPQAGNIYDIARYLAENSTEVSLGEIDSLTIGAQIAKFAQGRWEHPWCQAQLVLDSETIQALSAGESLERMLEDERGACRISVRLTVS